MHATAALIQSLVHAGILGYGVLFMLYLAARLTIGEQSRWVAVANNLLPWLCWIGIGLGALGLLYRDRWLLVALQLPAVITFGVAYGSQFWPASERPNPTGPTLTAVMYNVCG